MKPARVAALLLASFLCGGGSAEVAVRTHRAIARARAEREIGAAGQLVALELHGKGGEVLARPRVIAPPGKAAQLLLRDPSSPDQVRLSLRVEATREPSGQVAIDYLLSLPARDLVQAGNLSLTPGIEQAIELGEGEVTATVLALPVPSAAFDAYLEGEVAGRALPDSI